MPVHPAHRRHLLIIAGLGLLAVLAGTQIREAPKPGAATFEIRPTRIMGTTSRLVAVVPSATTAGDASRLADRALRAAEAALRRVEAETSTFIEASPIAGLNRAGANQPVVLPESAIKLLRLSRVLHADTRGAFDVTCAPLVKLWRDAGRQKRLPTTSEIEHARRSSSITGLTVSAHEATKTLSSEAVDLGGIAKGHAIDQAVRALKRSGVAAGLVDVGGDLRVFGPPPRGSAWEVMVRDPYGGTPVLSLEVPESAVCTSGGYFRFVKIDGKTYSHIIDPRTGRPARDIASATVIAPTATLADAWATALSVLGVEGLGLLPKGVDAILIVGRRDAPEAVATPKTRRLLAKRPPFALRFVPDPEH